MRELPDGDPVDLQKDFMEQHKKSVHLAGGDIFKICKKNYLNRSVAETASIVHFLTSNFNLFASVE